MGKIFIVMGKSASGKDSIYSQLTERLSQKVKSVTIYTTRPKREGEVQGREYFFRTVEEYEEDFHGGKMIEHRTYNTVFGPWHYYTMDDGQFDDEKDIIMIGTLEAFKCIKEYFGQQRVVPVYIEVDDYTRLIRAINREQKQDNPGYAEVCRRFLADEEDFSDEKLTEAGVDKKFINDNLDECVERVLAFISN